MFFFNRGGNPDRNRSIHYICVEAGSSKWNIDSSIPTLRGPAYSKPVFGVQYGNMCGHWLVELGIEANRLNTDGVGFGDYSKSNLALKCSLGMRLGGYDTRN